MTATAISEVPKVTPASLKYTATPFFALWRGEQERPRTLQSYSEATTCLGAFLRDRGLPTAPESITREHVTAWVNDLLSNWKATTAANRHRGAARFFAYLVDAGELEVLPMRR